MYDDVARLEGNPSVQGLCQTGRCYHDATWIALGLVQVGRLQRALPGRPLSELQCRVYNPFLSGPSLPAPAQPSPAELLWAPVAPERPQTPGRARPLPWWSPLPAFRSSSLPQFRRISAQMLPSEDFPVLLYFSCHLSPDMSVCNVNLCFFTIFCCCFAVPCTVPDPLQLSVNKMIVHE